MKTDVTHLLFN